MSHILKTMKEEGYSFVRFAGAKRAIFRSHTGTLEIFAANKGHASWGFKWHGTDWEFCSSMVTP